ncbi:AGAP013476-PA-like protein [Anopheles sinensis]|uniref:AGAP013476-PA-like protein n=1 Tax=Anopheles sinensis TaxID=74873 RepID=A0A084VGZ0_ANOSI|nr:AGAP013476-PA-like protein [Anopheles sinensis]
MRQHQQQQPVRNFRGVRKFRHFFYEQPENDDTILPIEALFTSKEDMSPSSTQFYGNRRDQRQQPRVASGEPKRQPLPIVGYSESVTLPSALQSETLQTNDIDESETTTVSSPEATTLATVTSAPMASEFAGAKKDNISTTTTATTPTEESTAPYGRDFSPTPVTDEQSTSTETGVHAPRSNVRSAKSAKVTQVSDERDQGMLPVLHSSNSHRSELSVEELDPTINRDETVPVEKDSAAEVQRVTSSPPTTLAPAPSDISDRMQDSAGSPFVQPFASQQRNRMQRKQDTKGTFQSIVYHERKDLMKSSSSLSYSYLGETTPTVKSWRDINEEYSLNRKRSSSVPPSSFGGSGKPADIVPEQETRKSVVYSEPARFYSEPAQFYSEPAKVYSEPAKIYGEPEKVYSQPAQVYSEPAKVYSEPAKVYSEPAKVYSQPAKIYSQPSSYWQTAYAITDSTEGQRATTASSASPSDGTSPAGLIPSTTTGAPQLQQLDSNGLGQNQRQRLVFNELDKIPYDQLNAPTVDSDTDSIHNAIGKFVPKQSHTAGTDEEELAGQKMLDAAHRVGADPVYEAKQQDEQQTPAAVQPLTPVVGSGDDAKVGYVVEGRNYRKYRVEEKTPDGFIVGEYGVLSHNDGNLRGVRYTADSDINPRLIYDALLKFLSL